MSNTQQAEPAPILERLTKVEAMLMAVTHEIEQIRSRDEWLWQRLAEVLGTAVTPPPAVPPPTGHYGPASLTRVR